MPGDSTGMSICMLLIVCTCRGFFCVVISSLCMVMFVFSSIFRFVFLNRFVINVCKGDPFMCGIVCLSDVVVGKPFFSVMAWMVLISSLYSFLCRWSVFSLLCRNLIAAYLCWAGWL